MALIELDYLDAVQIIAACEQRAAIFESHVANGVPANVIAEAFAHTIRAERVLRDAFHIPREEGTRTSTRCCGASESTPHWAGCVQRIPIMPEWSEPEARAAWGDR